MPRFAHEAAIVKLGFSPDGSKLVSLAEDRTVKAWRTSDYTEIQLWEASRTWSRAWRSPPMARRSTSAGWMARWQP